MRRGFGLVTGESSGRLVKNESLSHQAETAESAVRGTKQAGAHRSEVRPKVAFHALAKLKHHAGSVLRCALFTQVYHLGYRREVRLAATAP